MLCDPVKASPPKEIIDPEKIQTICTEAFNGQIGRLFAEKEQLKI